MRGGQVKGYENVMPSNNGTTTTKNKTIFYNV